MRVNSNNVLSYALLPGILPRLSKLVFSGSSTLNYLIARVLCVVRLLPQSHPALKMLSRHDSGSSKISLRSIMAEAAHNLTLNWANIDQVVIFTALLCGITMLFLYLLSMFFFVMMGVANAASWSTSLFQTGAPDKDVAFMMLDKVFGIPGLYGSEVSTNVAIYGTFPNVIHIALHQMLEFYSMGIFIIAMVIFFFHIVEIILDITQEGHVASSMSDDVTAPYANSSSKGFTWLPIRYLFAFGLLIPFGFGLNSAQWITLYVAKFGSGLATNAWVAYNLKSGSNPIGESSKFLTAFPELPDNTGLVKRLLLMKSCMMMNAYGSAFTGADDGTKGPYDVTGYVVNGANRKALFGYGATPPPSFIPASGYNSTPIGVASFAAGEAFSDILQFTDLSDIHIVLGYYDASDPTRFKDYLGGVLPVCGSVIVPVTGINGQALYAAEAYLYAVLYEVFTIPRAGKTLGDISSNSVLAVVREYFRNSSDYRKFLNKAIVPPSTANPDCLYDGDNDGYESVTAGPGTELGKCTEPIPSAYWGDLINNYYQYAFEVPTLAAYDFLADTNEAMTYSGFHAIGNTGYSAIGASDPFLMTSAVLERGWGGAGMWYNKISELNGSLFTAINSVPNVVKMPIVMQNISKARARSDATTDKDFCGQYNPRRAGSSEADTGGQNNQFNAEAAASLYALCEAVFNNEVIADKYTSNTTTYTNPVLGAMASIFSQLKLFDIRDNDAVSPMVQLSAIGQLLIDKSIFNLIVSFGASFAGGIAHIAGGNGMAGADTTGNAAATLATIFQTIAMIGMAAGVVLHYVVPFMPFVYFFFAVSAWVKTIFEAMVGVPLWALAHLRKGGAGLPGEAAASGYFLLLEILIRPVVTVFSLIATFAIFSAMVAVLNTIFSLVVSNALGGDTNSTNLEVLNNVRSITDQFFMTLLYIGLVYIIGLSCFKLINVIPDGVMRWSSSGVASFGRADTTEGLIDRLPSQVSVAVQKEIAQMGNAVKETFYKPAAEYSAGKAAERHALEQAKKKAELEAYRKAEINKGAPPPDSGPSGGG